MLFSSFVRWTGHAGGRTDGGERATRGLLISAVLTFSIEDFIDVKSSSDDLKRLGEGIVAALAARLEAARKDADT